MENRQIYPPNYDGMYYRKEFSAFSVQHFSTPVSLSQGSLVDYSSNQAVSRCVLFCDNADDMSQKRIEFTVSAENLEKVTFHANQDAIYPVSNTINQARGFVGLSKLSNSKEVTGFGTCVISDGDYMIECATLSLEQDEDIREPDMVHHKHKDALSYEQLRDLRNYAKQVEPAQTGAMTHPGGKEEVVCYADI